MASCICWELTLELSGGRRQAKLAGGRPLERRVRFRGLAVHCVDLAEHSDRYGHGAMLEFRALRLRDQPWRASTARNTLARAGVVLPGWCPAKCLPVRWRVCSGERLANGRAALTGRRRGARQGGSLASRPPADGRPGKPTEIRVPANPPSAEGRTTSNSSPFLHRTSRNGRLFHRSQQHETGDRTLLLKRDLTFDMSGGPKGAKRPLERPLDGGVRFQAYYSSVRNATWEMPASRMAAKATSTA